MEQHPEATITVEQVDGSYTKLLPELASGIGVPDVFMVQNTDIMSFVYTYEGQILDVTDLVEGEVGNFVDSAIATCYNKADGKYYGIPIDIGPCALMYRTDIFEQAGVDVNSIKTWDDYIEAGKKILEATNGEVRMTGFNMNGATSTDYMKMLFAQQGGSAVFAVLHHRGRVHIEDGVIQVADNHGLAVLVDDAFEIRIQIHFVILLKYLGYLIILIL